MPTAPRSRRSVHGRPEYSNFRCWDRFGWERHNLQGDGQADLVHHGGVDKAVCAYSAEHWPYWQTILPPDQLRGGAFGENFTLEQLTETDVCIGDVFSIGTAVVQISQPRQPCWKLARRWHIQDLAVRVEHTGFTGWYFRVLQEGKVNTHAHLQLLDRPCPEWTVATANRIMHHEREGSSRRKTLEPVPIPLLKLATDPAATGTE